MTTSHMPGDTPVRMYWVDLPGKEVLVRAIVLEKPGDFRVVERKDPTPPGKGMVLVGVRRIGVCGTDFHAYQGRQTFFSYPRVIGHELGAEVLECGPEVEGLSRGDLCAVEPYLHCGSCIACRKGKTNCCVRLKVLGVHVDGGMLGVLEVPAAKLHRSETLTLDQLALVEMFSVGFHAVGRAKVEKGERALVIGAGPIGLSVFESARLAGAKASLLEVSPLRIDFSREKLGSAVVVDGREDALSRVLERSSGEPPTVVFDCTGSPNSMNAAFGFVAHGGRLVLVGHYPGDITFHDPGFHGREMTLLASRNATGFDFSRVIRLMESKQIDLRPWITHRAGAEELKEAFPGWLEPSSGVLKGVVDWEEPAEP